MFLVWLAVEYGRPPNPMKIPFMVSLSFLAGWLLHSSKRWNPQIVLMLLFVGQTAMMIPFSENTFTAAMVAREVFVVVVAIAVPVAHFIDTSKRVEIVFRVWICIFAYMALIAVLNGGNGPGGAQHGVDENYTALFMTVAISFSFFAALTVRNVAIKVALYGAVALCVAAIVVGMSRGGFVGLVGVAAYCWWKSPGRIASLVGGMVAVALFLVFVPDSYMDEIRTIADTGEGTADARMKLWSIAVRMWLDSPLFGVGPGGFRWAMNAYKSVTEESMGSAMHVTHSLYFELLSEMGTTGVLTWLGILYFDLRDTRFVSRLSTRAQQRLRHETGGRFTPLQRIRMRRLRNADAWSSAMMAALIGFLLCSLFLSTLYYTMFWLLTAMIVALREATVREAALLRQSTGDPRRAARDPGNALEIQPNRRPAALSGLLGR